MPIKVKFDSDGQNSKIENTDEGLSFKLKARRSIDGNVMIFDHIDMDVVIMPEQKKIVAFAKESLNDNVYAAQSRMFDYLFRHGVVIPESVQGGNVYGSMEATYPETNIENYESENFALLSVAKFMEEEQPYFAYDQSYRDQEIDKLTTPDAQDSTELGDVSHAQKKGSIEPSRSRRYIRGYY